MAALFAAQRRLERALEQAPYEEALLGLAGVELVDLLFGRIERFEFAPVEDGLEQLVVVDATLGDAVSTEQR